jgi:hypothetical protein
MADGFAASSRRALIRAGVALATLAAARAQEQEKMAPALVRYQPTPSADSPEDICAKCVNWVAPDGCRIVAGPISPNGWCVAFAPNED